MADLNIEAMSKPTTPTTDYSGMQSVLEKAVSQTRQVSGLEGTMSMARDTAAKEDSSLIKAAARDTLTQGEATQKEADKAADVMQMQGMNTIVGLERLGEIGERVKSQYDSTAAMWDAPAEKADEYVTASRDRVRSSLVKLDELNEQMNKNMDFAKAHDMQVAAQSVLGSMKTEERSILQTYGAASKEYEQFITSKSVSLATAQSMVHGNYAKLQHERDLTFMNATNESMWKHNMYAGFQEQQHVEMLKWREQSKQAHDLQYAQFEIGLEQLKTAGASNFSDFIMSMPSFTMESAPLMTLLAETIDAERDRVQASRELRAQNAPESKSPRMVSSGSYGTYGPVATYGGGRR